jgi:excisionase family DNA binding protein
MADTDVMTVREVAEYLKVKERTIYRLVAKGGIPAFKVGGSWRFRKAEIDEWITRRTQDENIKDSNRQRK